MNKEVHHSIKKSANKNRESNRYKPKLERAFDNIGNSTNDNIISNEMDSNAIKRNQGSKEMLDSINGIQTNVYNKKIYYA